MMMEHGFILLRGENIHKTCTQSCEEENTRFSPISMCKGTHVWCFQWISVSWSHSRRLGCRSYLANVLVVAASVLLLQEKLVPHPTSSHSLKQLLSSERSQCSLSVQWQSVQRQAQTENIEHGQQDSPHLARRMSGTPVFSRTKLCHRNRQIILSVVVLQIVQAVKKKKKVFVSLCLNTNSINNNQITISYKSALKRRKCCSDRNISDTSEKGFKG